MDAEWADVLIRLRPEPGLQAVEADGLIALIADETDELSGPVSEAGKGVVPMVRADQEPRERTEVTTHHRLGETLSSPTERVGPVQAGQRRKHGTVGRREALIEVGEIEPFRGERAQERCHGAVGLVALDQRRAEPFHLDHDDVLNTEAASPAHRAKHGIRSLAFRHAEQALGGVQRFSGRQPVRRATAGEGGWQVLVEQVPERIDDCLVEHVVVEEHLMAAREDGDLGVRPPRLALDDDRMQHGQDQKEQDGQREPHGARRAPEIVTLAGDGEGVAKSDDEHAHGQKEQAQDQDGVLVEEGGGRHPDVPRLGEVGEEHFPEVLVALVKEEEVDHEGEEVEIRDRPQSADEHRAARVAGEERNGARREDLEAEHGRIQAKTADEHDRQLGGSSVSEPGDEEEAVEGEEQDVRCHEGKACADETERFARGRRSH